MLKQAARALPLHARPLLCLCLMLSTVVSGGCSGGDDDDDSATPPGDPVAFVLTSDYVTGGFALVDVERTVWSSPGLAHADAVIRAHGGMLYVLNRRGADNVQVIDPARGFETVANYSTGNGTNPQDIAFGPDGTGYIALYERDYLLAVDPATGEERGRLEIPETYLDSDGLPEASSVAVFGDHLLVIVQRLDRANNFQAANDSYLLRFDLTTGTFKDALELTFRNPFNLMQPDAAGRILLAEAGDFIDAVGSEPADWQDGGLELIDGPGFTSLGVVAEEAALGGDVVTAVISGDRMFAVVGTPTEQGTSTDVFRIEPGEALEAPSATALYTPGAWVVSDLAVDAGGTLWVADRTLTAPGLRLYPPDNGESFLPFGAGLLPPARLLFLE